MVTIARVRVPGCDDARGVASGDGDGVRIASLGRSRFMKEVVHGLLHR